MNHKNLYKLHEIFNKLRELLDEANNFSEEARLRYPNLALLLSLTKDALATTVPAIGYTNYAAKASVDVYTHLYTKTYKHKQYEFCNGTLIERPYRHTYKTLSEEDIRFIEEDERDLGNKQNVFVNLWMSKKDQQQRALFAAQGEDHHRYITDMLVYMTILSYYDYKDTEKINTELGEYLKKKEYTTSLKFEPDDHDEEKKKLFSKIASFVSTNQKICEVFENLENFERITYPKYSSSFFKMTVEYLLRREELNMFKSYLSLMYEFIASFDPRNFNEEREALDRLKADVQTIEKIYQILTDNSKLRILKKSVKTYQKNSYAFQEFLDSHSRFRAVVERAIKELESLKNELINSICPIMQSFRQFDLNQKLEISLIIQQDKDALKFLESILDNNLTDQYSFDVLKNDIHSLMSIPNHLMKEMKERPINK